jgi:YD repeat-containing protein
VDHTLDLGEAAMSRIITIVAFLLAGTAHAQQLRVYGPDGKSTGTITRDSAGNERIRDQSGRNVGTSSTSSDGTTTYYDAQGRVIGRSRK